MKSLVNTVVMGLTCGLILAVLLNLIWPHPSRQLTEAQKGVITQRIASEIMHGQLMYSLPEIRPPAVSFVTLDPQNASEAICNFERVSVRQQPAWEVKVNERMAAQHYRQFLRESIPHEVAHLLLCQSDPNWDTHDSQWETIVRSMGAEPVARHNYGQE